MKKSVVLFILVLVANSGFGQSIRNSLLGIYTGTYWNYSNGDPVVPAGAKITAHPTDTAKMIVHDTLNNYVDTIQLFVAHVFPENTTDTIIFYDGYVCGDIVPAKDSIMYARCNFGSGTPSAQTELKCISHTFPTSINNTLKYNSSIYPNPAIDKLSISIDSNSGFKAYCIYTIYGQLVDSGIFSPIIEIDNLPPGMYYLKLLGKSEVIKPFIKG